VAAQTERMQAGFAAFADLYGRAEPDDLRRAQSLRTQVPIAAVTHICAEAATTTDHRRADRGPESRDCGRDPHRRVRPAQLPEGDASGFYDQGHHTMQLQSPAPSMPLLD